MKKTFIISPESPYQRMTTWAHFNIWSVFGDYLPGYPDWYIDPHEDGTITASDGRGTQIDLGTWSVDEKNDLIIDIEHSYPTVGLHD